MNSPADCRLAQHLVSVRSIAQTSLARYSNAIGAGSRETFLLRDGHLVGFKFTLGIFHARWLIGEDTLQLFRENQRLVSISFEATPEIRRAA